jgi:hypothetical protein
MRLRHLVAATALLTIGRTALAQGADPAKPAPAPAPAAAPAAANFDPVGSYNVNLTAQGQAMAVLAKIEKKADGGYTGTVTSEAFPPLPITSVKVDGNKVKLTLTAPDGQEATINFEMKGNDFEGEWFMSNDGSKVSGKKLP